jgi:hypothetical protein
MWSDEAALEELARPLAAGGWGDLRAHLHCLEIPFALRDLDRRHHGDRGVEGEHSGPGVDAALADVRAGELEADGA